MLAKERGSTTRTEAGVVGVLPPTMAADGHEPEFRPINYGPELTPPDLAPR
jgi:hypothetical protein